jgi:hypothetical protein
MRIKTLKFEVRDHVHWNSEVGHVHGLIIRIYMREIDHRNHAHRTSADNPWDEIE